MSSTSQARTISFLAAQNMKERERIELIDFLKAKIKVFAWPPYKMPRIDPNFIRHELNVMPEAWPVNHQGRRLTAKHVGAVIEEVDKLKEESAITKDFYPSSLSNTVVVKKKNDN